MSNPSNFLAATPNGDFKLRHWRSPAFLRLKDPAAPATIDVRPAGKGDVEFSNWSSETNTREGYTSIRDLIVSSPRSCLASPSPTSIGSEIQIRNPLVKQAIHAYLQLTPSSTDSTPSGRDSSLQRCFGIIARLLCCASSGDLR